MINIRNLGSKESTGVTFKDGIYGKFVFGIYVILLSHGSFESDCPETKS